jgi:glycosyltransferase involved in cell wall biosynthesis
MASITALLHTENDALRLGRALETLYACDEIVVVDHGSRDGTVRIAREYGALVMSGSPGASPADYFRSGGSTAGTLMSADSEDWLLCLDPRESLTEKLAASLFEWKSEASRALASPSSAFSFFLREETAEGWVEVPFPQTRLVPHSWKSWKGNFPVQEPSAIALEGELLRFVFP